MRLSDTTREVISLDASIRDYWEAELPKRHRDYPLVQPAEDSGPPPAEESQLRDLLGKLSTDDLARLVSIAQVGRGDFPPNQFRRQLPIALQACSQHDWAISELLGMGCLGDYLSDGLAELSRSHVDIDDTAAVTRRPGA